MIAEAIEKLQFLVEQQAQPKVLAVDGRQYSLRDLKPVLPPQPTALKVHTLTGLVDYVTKRLAHDVFSEAEAVESTAVHVVSQAEVRVVGDLEETNRRRDTFAVAEFASLVGQATPFSFGQWQDAESFNVAMQALFSPDGDRAAVLSLVGNIREENVRTTGDDGTTQAVTARAGVALNAEVKVPNPVTLTPYRTFREVEQPASLFVLRLKAGGNGGFPTCALFEADGGAWKLEAVQRIASYLRKALPKGTVVIA